RVVLSEGAIGGIAHCFQVSDQGVADLVATRRFLRIGLDRCGNGAWFNNFQDRRFNGIVHPQTAKGDAPRLAIVELDLPRFRGEMRAWDQALWVYVMLSS